MNARPFDMNPDNCTSATYMSKARSESIIDLAMKIIEDPDKDSRLESCQCKACYYMARIGGAAMTNRFCGCCDENQLYSSTNTDALCKPCAVKHELCKHCGGDLHMRTRRRKWPSK